MFTSFHCHNYNTTLQKGQELSQHAHCLVNKFVAMSINLGWLITQNYMSIVLVMT